MLAIAPSLEDWIGGLECASVRRICGFDAIRPILSGEKLLLWLICGGVKAQYTTHERWFKKI
jgi:hypothetical protein